MVVRHIEFLKDMTNISKINVIHLSQILLVKNDRV